MADDEPLVCGRRWRAPRHDVPTSVDVDHVCCEPQDAHAYGVHATGHPVALHRCACGAGTPGATAGLTPPPPPRPTPAAWDARASRRSPDDA